MKLYRSDKIRFIMGLVIIFILYSCYYIFIAEQRDTAMIPRKLRHFISLLFTIAVYFAGTFHLGKLKWKLRLKRNLNRKLHVPF